MKNILTVLVVIFSVSLTGHTQVTFLKSDLIKKSFSDFGISFDNYSRTSSKIHHETASEFFKLLEEQYLNKDKT